MSDAAVASRCADVPEAILGRGVPLASRYGRGVRAFPLFAKPPYAASKAPHPCARLHSPPRLLGCQTSPGHAGRSVARQRGGASVSSELRERLRLGVRGLPAGRFGSRTPPAVCSRPPGASSGCFARFRYRVGSSLLCQAHFAIWVFVRDRSQVTQTIGDGATPLLFGSTAACCRSAGGSARR